MATKVTIINEVFVSLLLKIVYMYKIAIFFAFWCAWAGSLLAQKKYEVRATWLTTLGGMDWPTQKANSPEGIQKQKDELCNILDKLKEAHFNTILFQTRLRGDVIYPSYLEGYAECLTGCVGRNPGYDPLQFAIEECHKRGLALHAWVVTLPIGSKRQVRLLGKHSVVVKHPQICKLFKNNWYLDPGEPETGNYLSNIIREIVARYDVDGIHFDYLRYPEHGLRFPDYRSYRKYGKQQPLNQWRRDNLTQLVRRLYTEIKQVKPWVIVSSAPIGKFNDTHRYRSLGWNAYEEVHQDAQRWMKTGIHDALFPMMYFRDNHFYPFALDWKEHKNGRWVVPGLGIYFLQTKGREWQLDDVLQQISFTRQYDLDGQAYFRNYFLLKNSKGIWTELCQQLYATPAVTPPLTWLDSIAPAAPILVQFYEGKEASVTLKWKPSSTQKPGGIYYRLYASNTYPVDTQQGKNIQAIQISDTTYRYTPSLPWQKKLYWALTAVDRYGNESEPMACNTPQKQTLPIYSSLPDIPKGYQLILTSPFGQELARIPRDPIPSGKGIYHIRLLSPNGTQELIGILSR